MGLKTRFEEHHQVKYSHQGVACGRGTCRRIINDRHMPDKAIDVIDRGRCGQPAAAGVKALKTVSVSDVETVVAKIARIPPRKGVFERYGGTA